MNMNLKVLLVDDEINIIKNLQMVIPWEQMGIEVIGLAKNGVEALEYVTEDTPDILFTDIRMPVMDGITLLQKVREVNTQCEILMLTGYQDFEYARSAIQFKAKDYILKPINYAALEESVQQLAAQIRSQKAEKMIEKEKWGKVANLAYEKILFDALMDYSSIHEPYFHHVDEENDFNNLSYMMLLIDIDEYSKKSRMWNEKERRLWNFAVKNVLQDTLEGIHLHYALLQKREGEWCILIEHQKGLPFNLMMSKQWSESLQKAVNQYVKLEISVGIYPDFVSISELSNAYKKIQRNLQFSLNECEVMVLSTNTNEKNSSNAALWKIIEEMVSGLKQGKREMLEQSLISLNENLKSVSEQSYMQVERILHFLILHLLREMREMKVIAAAYEEELWASLEDSHHVKDLMDVISNLIDHSMEMVLNKKSTEIFMLSGKDYIDRNLKSDLGIEELADFLGISCSYFSMLFKQHFGETFVEYVTKQRMEFAKSMLVMSDQSIAKIGQSVGYMERRYFTKVFQKYSGQTPSEYRESNVKG
jgi:two-component system response regulator YesN